jgi:hypothetical protein
MRLLLPPFLIVSPMSKITSLVFSSASHITLELHLWFSSFAAHVTKVAALLWILCALAIDMILVMTLITTAQEKSAPKQFNVATSC